jgi:hypothetical protein
METKAPVDGGMTHAHAAMGTATLTDWVHEWADRGLITEEQAAQLVASVESSTLPAPAPSRTRAVLVEAVAYLGGAIVVTSSILLGSLFWGDLSDAVRLVLVGTAAAGLVAGGGAVRATHHAASGRLRSALWAASVAVTAGALAVAAGILDLGEVDAAVFVSAGTTGVAAVLWSRWRTPAQQAVTMAAAAMAAAAALVYLDLPDQAIGLGPWLVGIAWALLGWAGRTRPSRVGQTAGSAMAVLGAMMTASSDAGTVLTLATLVLLVAAALRLGDPLLLGVAAIGVVINVPAAVARWFPGSVGVPVALLVVGLLVVLVAVVMSRRDRRRPTAPPPPGR